MSSIFGPARQLGLVVRDFDAAMLHWAEVQGIGPFYCIRNSLVDNYRYKGKEAPSPLVSLSFAYQGDLQIEIIAQHNDAPSCYLDFLNSGREGAHHVSGFCTSSEDFNGRYAKANDAGIYTLHEGAMGGIRFAYFDTERAPGSIICEISEADMPAPRELFDRMRATAAAWDGKNPIRSIEEA